MLYIYISVYILYVDLYQFLTLMTKVVNTWRTSKLFQIQQITSAGLSRELWRFARSFHLDQWVVAIRSVTLEVARGLQESWSIPEMEIFTTNLMIARSRYDKVPMKDRFCFCTSGEVWGNFWKESVTPNSNSHLCNLMILLKSVEECGSVCIALKAFSDRRRGIGVRVKSPQNKLNNQTMDVSISTSETQPHQDTPSLPGSFLRI